MKNHQHHGTASPPATPPTPAQKGGSHQAMLRDMRRPWLWTKRYVARQRLIA